MSWNKVFTRTEVKLIQPLWDFGKISAGVAAAEAGVGVSRQREAGARADLELNVRKAYYGLKFARDVIDMLDEGSSYVDDAAEEAGQGSRPRAPGNVDASPTSCACARCAPSWTARILEAKRLQGIARDSLRTLVGPEAPTDSTSTTSRSSRPRSRTARSRYYEDLARFGRPEVRLLEYAVKAKHALADLERRKEYPDLVLDRHRRRSRARRPSTIRRTRS